MRKLVFSFLSLLVMAAAQEGHPLSGSWHGQFKPATGQPTRLVMIMKWDGKQVVGTMNPGPNAVPLKVEMQGWQVHLEAAKPQITADGKLDKVGSYHRTISGTWTQGSVKGDFTITRD